MVVLLVIVAHQMMFAVMLVVMVLLMVVPYNFDLFPLHVSRLLLLRLSLQYFHLPLIILNLQFFIFL